MVVVAVMLPLVAKEASIWMPSPPRVAPPLQVEKITSPSLVKSLAKAMPWLVAPKPPKQVSNITRPEVPVSHELVLIETP